METKSDKKDKKKPPPKVAKTKLVSEYHFLDETKNQCDELDLAERFFENVTFELYFMKLSSGKTFSGPSLQKYGYVVEITTYIKPRPPNKSHFLTYRLTINFRDPRFQKIVNVVSHRFEIRRGKFTFLRNTIIKEMNEIRL
jgi:hypothetical protein